MKKVSMFFVILMTAQVVFAEQEKPTITLTPTTTEIKHVGNQVWFIKHLIKDSSSCGDSPKANCTLYRSEVLRYESFTFKAPWLGREYLLKAYSCYLKKAQAPIYRNDYLKTYFSDDYFTRHIDYADKRIVIDGSKREIYSVSENKTESEFSMFTLSLIVIALLWGIRVGTRHKGYFSDTREISIVIILLLLVINLIIIGDSPSGEIFTMLAIVVSLVINLVCSFSSDKNKEITVFWSDCLASVLTLGLASYFFFFQIRDTQVPLVLLVGFTSSFVLFSFIENKQAWVISLKSRMKWRSVK